MLNHKPSLEHLFLTRRQLLRRCGMGMGAVALSHLLAQNGMAATGPGGLAGAGLNPLSPRQPQFPGKAKRVVHLFMNGGPSQVDTFDPKPMLTKYGGKELPTTNLKTERKTGAAFA
jgi:hypothetical protein